MYAISFHGLKFASEQIFQQPKEVGNYDQRNRDFPSSET